MSILKEIVDWTETKSHFWQMTVDRLIRKNNIDEADLNVLLKICKSEHFLINFKYTTVDFDSLKTFIQHANADTNISILSIKNVENISALSNVMELQFAPTGLTIIYGDNGSGKSSYSTILKHVCSTRGIRPPIHPNLFIENSASKDKKANIFFSQAGNVKQLSLINSVPSSSVLRAVNVFDTSSANHYVESEDEIAFMPAGINLLDKFARTLGQIENELNKEKQMINLKRFDFSVLQLPTNSAAYAFLIGINAATTREELVEISHWDNDKQSSLDGIDTEIAKLKSTDPNSKVKRNTEIIRRLRAISLHFQNLEDKLFGKEKLQTLKDTKNNLISTVTALKISSDTIFSDLPLNGIGSATWKQLWESARKFYNESKQDDIFPDTNDNCPLCLQTLDENAKQRFKNFEEFVKNDLQKQFDNSNNQLIEMLTELNAIDFTIDVFEPTIVEIESIIPDYSKIQLDYLSTLQKFHTELINFINNGNKIEDITKPTIAQNAKLQVDSLILELESQNKVLSIESIEEQLAKLESKRLDLFNQNILYTFRPKIYREILRLKRVKHLESAISKCNTRSLTTLSNHLTQIHVSTLLKDAFKNELKELGFNNISIEAETKGARGKQYHYLRLNENNEGNAPLKDILSEGEHRCIALATFLAEVNLAEHKSTVVFDDPVSSLDHKWRNKIAARIAREAKNRQVVVLTHDISFLIMIQEHSDKIGVPITVNSLTRKKQETGIIESNPPWDALSTTKRIGILKDQQQALAKLEKTETEVVVKPKIQNLYGRLRQTWERFIEEVYLNDTIKRFGREIQTQRLSKIGDLTEQDYNMVEQNMSKCSTYMIGHDSAGELNVEIPCAQEFLEDILTLETYAKEIRKRRNN